jgi:hypothetical protein
MAPMNRGSHGQDAGTGDDYENPAGPFCSRQGDQAMCREFRPSRKVVRKVPRSEATEFRYEREAQPLSRIGPWRTELDGLLRANMAKPARERLKLIRILETLRSRGYAGGYVPCGATCGGGRATMHRRRWTPTCR